MPQTNNNKPCPFCGSTSAYTDFEDARPNTVGKWGFAACSDCNAQIESIRTQYDGSDNAQWRKDALLKWNTRYTDK